MEPRVKMRVKYDGGPQENLRAAVNTNEKRNHEICFITVS